MKVLHVLASPHLGGAEMMCLYLAHEQQNSGRETAVHFFRDGVSAAKAREWNIPVFIGSQTATNKADIHRENANGLLKTVAEFRPNIVHSHVPLTNLICSRALEQNVPWIATIHGSWRQFGYSPEALNRPLKKYYLLARHAFGDYWTTRKAAHVVAISDYVKRELAAVGVPKQKISVIHDGLPFLAQPVPAADARRQLGLPEKKFIIGSLGHFAPVKGFDILIRGYEKIAAAFPETVLVIAGGDVLGDTTVRDSLKRLISSAGLTDKVTLLGTQTNLSLFYSALDLFVVSSRSEGFSLALLEAMQYGKPSIVTDAGGSSEAARPEEESVLFRSGHPESLAESLGRLLSDSSLREKLSASSLSRAKETLTLAQTSAAYNHVYSIYSSS